MLANLRTVPFLFFKATAVGCVAPKLAEAQGNWFGGRSTVASPSVNANCFLGRPTVASPSVTPNVISIILGSTCLRRPSADRLVAALSAADFLHHAGGGGGREEGWGPARMCFHCECDVCD